MELNVSEVAAAPVEVADRPSPLTLAPILAVDDDEDNLHLIRKALDLFGLATISTSSALEALRLARTYCPRLILLDIVMPELSGYEIIRYLRRQPATLNIPIIAITALSKPEDRQMLLQSGCNDYLSKPYNLDDLEAILIQHLGAALPLP